ncbi:DoxX family protein [Corynebacterium anserum]|uniref:DoxX family membrane protein n=1 Tax=Corynebacterium anserum TaxID=2684406 RepID=A0A7G7YP25_9CORY|nr:DoxX family protein [Corynebacterium anserum]MBC2681847.1 DoxX family membrane protein [Corynebacterium anserum]QNH96245.1 DoxX family membrane protein [Corynebacterium anserum]
MTNFDNSGKNGSTPKPGDEHFFDPHDDIDVPVYRRDAHPGGSAQSASQFAKGANARGKDEIAVNKQSADVDKNQELDKTQKFTAVSSKTKGAQSSSSTSRKSASSAQRTASPQPERTTGADKQSRDIYAMLGRARPQRIEAQPVHDRHTVSAENEGEDHPDNALETEEARTTAHVSPKTVSAMPGAQNEAQTKAKGEAAVAQQSSHPRSGDSKIAGAQCSDSTTKKAAVAASQPANAKAPHVQQQPVTRALPEQKPLQPVMVPGTEGNQSSAPQSETPTQSHGRSSVELQSEQMPEGLDGEQLPEAPQGDVPHDVADEDQEQPIVEKRGTIGFGVFVLRLVAGIWLLVMGLQNLFGFGGASLNNFEAMMFNYNSSHVLAFGLSIGAVIGGVSVLLGLLTPLGAAVGTVVAGFMGLHALSESTTGFWPSELDPTFSTWILIAVICLSLVLTGPGKASFDRSRGWAVRPLASAWIFAIIALGGLIALWVAVGGGNPLG